MSKIYKTDTKFNNKTILSNIFKGYEIALLNYSILSGTVALFTIQNIYLSYKLIDALSQKDIEELMRCALLTVFCFMANKLTGYCLMKIKLKTEKDIRIRIKSRLYLYISKISEVEWKKSDITTGQLLTVFNDDSNRYTDYIFEFINFVQMIIYIIVAEIFLVTTNKVIAIFATLAIPLSYLFSNSLLRKIRCIQEEIIKKNDYFFDLITEIAKGLNELRCNGGSYILGKFLEKRMEEIKDKTIENEEKRYFYQTVISSIGFVTYFFILLLGGMEVIRGEISIGIMFACIMYSKTLSGNVSAVFDGLGRIKQYQINVKRLCQVLVIGEEKSGESPFEKKGIRLIEAEDIIVIKGKNIILNCFSKRYTNYGKPYIIRGENGSGKTTLLNSLSGQENISNGRVLFDNEELDEKKKYILSNCISFLVSNPQMYSMSLLDNIRLFSPDATEHEIEELLREVGLWDDVQHYKNGLSSLVNQDVKLSSGQSQKVAICRILLKKSRVFFWDEPLNNLDSKTQITIEKIIENLSAKKINIVTTHYGFNEKDYNTTYLGR
ncbi:MAG: ABC transporter ATP-binding protein [Lachnospiraceae bacterium]|nr:ABC transporter ATP-binding protein [Lachnospiraceae bacterium]